MEPRDFEKLDRLISRRERASRQDQMGIIYVVWGIYANVGYWIFLTLNLAPSFWIFWTPAGVLIQAIVLRLLHRVQRPIWERMATPIVWGFALLIIPLITYFYAHYQAVYSPKLTYTLLSLWLGMSMFSVGTLSKQIPIVFGAVVWIAVAPFYLYFQDLAPWLLTASHLFGLVVPGLWSMYDERR